MTNSVEQVPEYSRYWGKSPLTKLMTGARYHLLCWHSLDVAACGYQMVMTNRFGAADILAELGFTHEAGASWFGWLLAVHDIGKFARGFQNLYAHDNPALAPHLAGFDYLCRHDTLGYWLWKQLAEGWLNGDSVFLPECGEMDDECLLDTMDIWMQISTGHHGIPPEAGNENGVRAFDKTDITAAREYWLATRELFNFNHWQTAWQSTAWRKRLRQHSWQLAGIITLSDWLGSDSTFFPWQEHIEPLVDYWHGALARATTALAQLPQLATVSEYQHYLRLFPYLTRPTPLQKYAAERDISAPGPQLVVLEDVTGAGKTEAAMILTHRLMAAGKGRGLYVGLPTMATANAMYERLAKAYRTLFDEHQRPSLVLAHGARQMSEQFRQSVWHDDQPQGEYYSVDEPGAASQCSAWFADSRKKALLAEVGVGTLDQILMAVMPFRHQSLRLLGLRDKILLLDEVHAYDGYMVRLLEGLLFFHAAQGGSVIILSATLHYALRCRLLDAFAAGAGFARALPQTQAGYPWFTHLSAEGLTETRIDTRKEVAREVGIHWFSSVDEGIALIYRAVAAGESVCWIRNTVDEATAVYQRLLNEGRVAASNVLLFHSRFAFGDRMAIENRALRQFGKHSTAQMRRGQVIIATQVIEQSLDIDVDNMLSDLAPVDLLIQRAGRLQRHIRTASGDPKSHLPDERPGPVLCVLVPDWQPEPASVWLGQALRGTGFVYPDHACLWRTQRVLRELGAIRMPQDARLLVESVYSEDALLPPGLQRNADDALGQLLSQRAAAKGNLLVRDKGYDRKASDFMWDDAKEISTRLSEEGVEVYLAYWNHDTGLRPYADDDAFSWEKSRLQVRKSWWQKQSSRFELPPDEVLDAFRKRLHRPAAQLLLIKREGETSYYSSQYGLKGE